MERVAFRLKVRKEMMEEYARRHSEVWPEMLEALRTTGWTNYSIFLDRADGALFGYFENRSAHLDAGADFIVGHDHWPREST